MECSCRRTFVAIIIYLSIQDKVLCQNNKVLRENRECSKLPSTSSSDMLNSILNNAACNGVLPDLIPMLQGQSIVETLSRFPYPQEILTKPLSIAPMPPVLNVQEPIIFSNPPIRPLAPGQNVLLATLPCGSSCPSNMIPIVPQTISPPPLPPSNCVSPIAQALPLENYPVCTPNVGVVRPTPIVLQPQSQCNEVNSYFYNQITEPILLPDVCPSPLNLPMSPPAQILPTPCSGTLEINNCPSPCLPQPMVFTNEGPQAPLQINVPTASVSAPRVTVVSANPLNSPVSVPVPYCPDYSANLPCLQYPPQPPIVVGGSSKSSLQKWLPIILMALFSDRGCNNDGGGCCRCCCSCNGGSGNSIPIPYPIPIPVNNPIVNTCTNPYSCRNREGKDDADEDDDRKKK